jgi:hypothetical protein
MLKRKSGGEFFERNLENCCEITRNLDLATFLHESTSILHVYENYSEAYGFNSLAFFLTSSVGFGHFGGASSTFCATSNSHTKTGLFLVIVGPSGKIFVR